MSLIDTSDVKLKEMLENYAGLETWHTDLAELKKKHPLLRYGSGDMKSMGKQLVNFLAYHQGQGFDRTQLGTIQIYLSEKTGSKTLGDVIQGVNKTDQGGLKRCIGGTKSVPLYGIKQCEYTEIHLAKRINTTSKEFRANSEANCREYFDALSKDSYEMGHKDPDLPLNEDNTVMQPKLINRAYKDHFKFDERGLPLCPTVSYLDKRLDKFYTRPEEYVSILTTVTKKLGKEKIQEILSQTPD